MDYGEGSLQLCRRGELSKHTLQESSCVVCIAGPFAFFGERGAKVYNCNTTVVTGVCYLQQIVNCLV